MSYQKIFSWFLHPGYLQTFLVGCCLGIGFIVPALWWFALPAIVWIVRLFTTTIATRRLVVLLAIIWGIKSLISLAWFWSAYPIDWVTGLSAGAQLVLIATYWLTSGLWLSSGGVLFGLLIRGLLRYRFFSPTLIYGLVPLFWVVSEMFAAVVFSVLTIGPGSFIQSYFSFGTIGYLLGSTPFGLYLAGIAGVYGLSFILVSLAVVLFLTSTKLSLTQNVSVWAVLIVMVSIVSFPVSYERGSSINVIGIDTLFDPVLLSTDEGYQIKRDELVVAVKHALALSPDYILLPEDSRYLQANFDDTSPKQAMAYWQFMNADTQTILIDSGRYTTEFGSTVLRASVFDGKTNSLWQFDKQYLVPQGEFVPWLYAAALRLLGYGAIVDRVANDSSYVPGPLKQTDQLPDYLPGVLFCFESVDPMGATKLTDVRAIPFIAHPISHGWFHAPRMLSNQLDVMLQIQARDSGIPIVSAGNMATGKLYMPTGKIEDGTIIETSEYFTLRQYTF